LGRERIQALPDLEIPGVKPDLTFRMDLDPAVGIARAAARTGETSSYELLELDYFHRVRKGFLEIAKREPERCRVIDASQDEDAVHAAIWSEVEAFLAKQPA
jgi:dTMP kinase